MRVAGNLVFTLMVILESIADSSAGPSSTSDRDHPPDAPVNNPSDHSHVRSSSAVLPLRERSRSPPPLNVFGYGLDQLEFIRLISFKNPQRHFGLRKYTFPGNKPIVLLVKPHKYGPIPNREQIVLSTPDGEAFAILESTNFLVGIYAYNPRTESKRRAKVNIHNGQVTPLDEDEIKETPVGPHRQVLYGYSVEHLNHSHASMYLPTSLPSPDGSEYGLDQLQSIQLIPNKNPDLVFSFERYTFPVDKPILLCQGPNRFAPVPIQELIVMRTSDGEVFAIVESSNELVGLYTYIPRSRSRVRVKINMRSGTVTPLTRQEVVEVPVGNSRPIVLNFVIKHVNKNLPRHSINQK